MYRGEIAGREAIGRPCVASAGGGAPHGQQAGHGVAQDAASALPTGARGMRRIISEKVVPFSMSWSLP